MKKQKTKLTAFIFGFILSLNIYAQGPTNNVQVKDPDHKNAIGFRAGQTSGLTVKHFFNSDRAIEGIVGVWPNTLILTGLYECYKPFGDVKGLNWYFGGGGHIAFGSRESYYIYYSDRNRYSAYHYNYPGLGIGIDGIFGTEYRIPQTPIAISLDIKPLIEVNSMGMIFSAFDPGIGFKIIL
jgi:hypothetical protein